MARTLTEWHDDRCYGVVVAEQAENACSKKESFSISLKAKLHIANTPIKTVLSVILQLKLSQINCSFTWRRNVQSRRRT